MYNKRFGVLILMFALNCEIRLQAAEVQHVRCEYLVNPLGIDAEKPRLSWEIKSDARGLKQAAYQILVASSEERLKNDKGDLWDSGKVASDQQNQIAYAGKMLESKMRCYWKVRIWISSALNPDTQTPTPSIWSSPAYWTMGLLTADAWKAKWIGLNHVIPENAFNHEITEGKLVIKTFHTVIKKLTFL